MVVTIADLLDLESYAIVGHSWGGMCACITALTDCRCKKALILVGTGDTCDVFLSENRLGAWVSIPGITLLSGNLCGEAEKAQVGKSCYQAAWNDIDPWRTPIRTDLEMLFFNRVGSEDHIMREEKVERYCRFCQDQGARNIRAEFISIPGCPSHEMPFCRNNDLEKGCGRRFGQFFDLLR